MVSYLSNRSQIVKIKDCVSQSRFTNEGIPQGSVIGPLLFLIYLNSIFYTEFNSDLVAFGDDLVSIYNEQNRIKTIEHIQQDFRLLRKWCVAHSMILNHKTKLMFFSLNDVSIVEPIIIYHDLQCTRNICSTECRKIECVQKFKYLWLTIDNCSSWKYHIDVSRNYLVSMIRKMYSSGLFCPIAILKNVYFAMVDSKLSYGLVCWGGTYYARVQPIFIAQKHIPRTMNNKPKLTESWLLFRSLEIFPLRHLFVWKVMKI